MLGKLTLGAATLGLMLAPAALLAQGTTTTPATAPTTTQTTTDTGWTCPRLGSNAGVCDGSGPHGRMGTMTNQRGMMGRGMGMTMGMRGTMGRGHGHGHGMGMGMGMQRNCWR